jgi:hypothetical protein
LTAPPSDTVETPVKLAEIDAGGALQDRDLFLERDPHAHEARILPPQLDRLDLARGHALEGHLGAVGKAADRLREEDVVFLLVGAAELHQPDEERRQQREQQQGDGPDPHVVCPRFHRLALCLPRRGLVHGFPVGLRRANPTCAARPRGPLKYSWIHGWSLSSSSEIGPIAMTLPSPAPPRGRRSRAACRGRG